MWQHLMFQKKEGKPNITLGEGPLPELNRPQIGLQQHMGGSDLYSGFTTCQGWLCNNKNNVNANKKTLIIAISKTNQ